MRGAQRMRSIFTVVQNNRLLTAFLALDRGTGLPVVVQFHELLGCSLNLAHTCTSSPIVTAHASQPWKAGILPALM